MGAPAQTARVLRRTSEGTRPVPVPGHQRQAEKFADEEYTRIGQQPAYYEMDNGTAAEMANNRAQEFYGLLTDLHREMTLATLAGLYHQWDKDLRGFIDSELGKDGVASKDIKKVVWKRDIAEVFKLLADFGWDCRAEGFYADLDAARLVVNVYKHGKGKSLDDLVSQHPEFLRDGLPEWSLAPHPDYVDHEWLSVSDEQFDPIATARGTMPCRPSEKGDFGPAVGFGAIAFGAGCQPDTEA